MKKRFAIQSVNKKKHTGVVTNKQDNHFLPPTQLNSKLVEHTHTHRASERRCVRNICVCCVTTTNQQQDQVKFEPIGTEQTYKTKKKIKNNRTMQSKRGALNNLHTYRHIQTWMRGHTVNVFEILKKINNNIKIEKRRHCKTKYVIERKKSANVYGIRCEKRGIPIRNTNFLKSHSFHWPFSFFFKCFYYKNSPQLQSWCSVPDDASSIDGLTFILSVPLPTPLAVVVAIVLVLSYIMAIPCVCFVSTTTTTKKMKSMSLSFKHAYVRCQRPLITISQSL